MADVTVSITIKEASVPAVVKAICREAGVPVENANAKPALISLVRSLVEREKRQEATVVAPLIE